MKRTRRLLITFMYSILVILYMVTIVISYGSVERNLNGWHGFTSDYVVIFVGIGIVLISGSVYNAVNLWMNNLNTNIYLMGGVLVIAPLIFYIISISLAGNVKTDLEYLIVRTAQGFDSTCLYLLIIAVIGYIILWCPNFLNNERK